jgi:hypothetical protein
MANYQVAQCTSLVVVEVQHHKALLLLAVLVAAVMAELTQVN